MLDFLYKFACSVTVNLVLLILFNKWGGVNGELYIFLQRKRGGALCACSSRGFALCHACAVSVTTVEFFRLLLY